MKILQAVIAAAFALVPAAAMAATPCEELAALALPSAEIDMATSVPAGDFTLPGGQGQTFRALPAFCRVAATLRPTSDSDIKIEVWLPTAGWNGKLQAVGNGGWAGSISYGAMVTALKAGYATVSTDTGHTSPGGAFVVGHPEKLADFSWRSEHEMTLKAKAVIGSFYGSAPSRSYFNGCSTGGKQGLIEATRFPEGIDAPICQDTRLGGLGDGLACAEVCHDALVDLSRKEAFKASDDLAFGPAIGGASGDVVAGWLVESHADDDGSIEGGVGVSVTAPIEPMPAGGSPGRGRDRTGATQLRERGFGANPVGVIAEEDQHLGRDAGADPEALTKRGRRLDREAHEVPVVRRDFLVEGDPGRCCMNTRCG